MSSTYQIQQLLEKATSGDPDFRIMFLQDVKNKAGEPNFTLDDATETKLVEQVLNMFNDSNSEVKGLAASTISVLVAKVKEDRVQKIIEKLTVMTSAKDDALRDVASLGLKTVVKEIAPDSKLAITACNKLAPKIVAQLKNTSSSQDLLIQLIEVLGDIYARFEATIRANADTQKDGLEGLTPLLSDPRGAVRKRAIRALGNLVACSGEPTFASLVEKHVLPALSEDVEIEQTKTAITLIGVLAVSAPRRTGKRVQNIVPSVIRATVSEDEDLKEVALQTLETLLLKCPSETNMFMTDIVNAANELVKYDPNYAAADDDMDEDGVEADEEPEEDEDEDFGEDYDDDDDVSWKVRRAAVKVLQMAIQTRLEQLAMFYRIIAPILISRFAEREETVRLEVWNTYTALLKQTYVWGGNVTSAIPISGGDDALASRPGSPAMSLKRKRESMGQTEDSPLSLLASQNGQVTKAVIKQLSSTKSLPVRLAGFQMLKQLTTVLQGGLESNISALVPVIEVVLKSGDYGTSASTAGGSITNLKIQAFSLLSLLFRTHQLRVLQPHLGSLVPLIISAIGDKSPKIGASALQSATELVKLMRPASPQSPSTSSSTSSQVKQIYKATVDSLGRINADQEIREQGIVCLGDLLLTASEDLGAEVATGLQVLKDRVRNENTRLVTLMTISKLAESPASKNEAFGPFMQEIAFEVGDYLRKSNKPVQAASFVCLEAILKRSGSALPLDGCQALINNLQPAIANPDIHLSRALNCVSAILTTHSQTLALVQESILPTLLKLIASSSSITASASDAVLRFFAAYVQAGGDAESTVRQLSEVAATSSGKVQVLMTASRCIGAIHRCVAPVDAAKARKIVDSIASQVTSSKAHPTSQCLALLSVGEIGRNSDLSSREPLFKAALNLLGSAHEEVRSSAAFAIGNMAAGSPSALMPTVLNEIERAGRDDRRMHLLLSSVKEVLSHSSPDTLASLSGTLWAPLFQLCENASAQQKAAGESHSTGGSSAKAGDDARLDGTRNIAAECLGKITLTNPATYLGQLQSRLQATSAGTRGAVITAIRFTFTDASSGYDDLLAPLIVQFLSLMHDEDLTVRRLAVSALTSAAHNKPQLVRDHLTTLQPLLYEQAKPNPALIHEVTMGPFKVKVDDGLNSRKAAFQCMYTLLETCLNKLDINAYLDLVIGGLSDDDDIKLQCYLMLVRLSHVAPTAVLQRLDSAADPLDKVLKTALKETAVKQEVEKLAEMQRSVLRAIVALMPLMSSATSPAFSKLVEEVRSGQLYGAEFRELVANAEQTRPSANSDRMDLD